MATNGAAPSPIPAQLDAILKQDADRNRVPVHTFDPDASPQGKAASAGKARDQLQSIISEAPKLPDAPVKGLRLPFQCFRPDV